LNRLQPLLGAIRPKTDGPDAPSVATEAVPDGYVRRLSPEIVDFSPFSPRILALFTNIGGIPAICYTGIFQTNVINAVILRPVLILFSH
jgi:hypothetical protein